MQCKIWGRDRRIVRPYPRWDVHLAMDHPHHPRHIHLSNAFSTCFAQTALADLSLKLSEVSLAAGGHGGVAHRKFTL
jgi:hypothetical protein